MLPKLNDVPKYKMTIPSSGKSVRFRPYLVSEEKVLMMFQESGDINNGLEGIIDLVVNCTEGISSKRELTTFDIDYMFIQLRAKSVGEKSEFILNCEDCGHGNEYTLDLQSIQIEKPKPLKKKVKLSEEYSVELKYPSYSEIELDENGVPEPISWIASCLSALCSKEERTDMRDESIEDVRAFVSNLTSKQFGDILDSVSDIPVVKHDAVFECKSCKKENTRTIEGINTFF